MPATLPGPQFDFPTVQPVANRYTHYATWPTIRSPDRPARSQSLYPLRYLAHNLISRTVPPVASRCTHYATWPTIWSPGPSRPQPVAVPTTLPGPRPYFTLSVHTIQFCIAAPQLDIGFLIKSFILNGDVPYWITWNVPFSSCLIEVYLLICLWHANAPMSLPLSC